MAHILSANAESHIVARVTLYHTPNVMSTVTSHFSHIFSFPRPVGLFCHVLSRRGVFVSIIFREFRSVAVEERYSCCNHIECGERSSGRAKNVGSDGSARHISRCDVLKVLPEVRVAQIRLRLRGPFEPGAAGLGFNSCFA